MSIGDGRDGKMRAAMARGRLSGRLAGLSLPRQIIAIAGWPLLEQVMAFICASTSLFLATRMGRTPEETTALAAGIGVVGYVMWMGFLLQGAVGMGATAVVSRMTGARRFAEANAAANQAALLGLLAGVLSALLMFFCSPFLVCRVVELTGAAQEVALQYMRTAAWVAVFSGVVFALNASLRGSGDTRTPFLVMLCVDGLNTLLGVVLVDVFDMGVDGLAWGMLGGMGVACAFLLGLLLWRALRLRRERAGADLDAFAEQRGLAYVPPLHLSPRALLPQPLMLFRIVSVGVPQAVEQVVIWVIQLYIISVISHLGDAAVGAHNIAIRIESISFMTAFALGIAGSTIVGQYLGARNIRMALEAARRCLHFTLWVCGAMGVVFFLFPTLFVAVFAKESPELLAAAVPVVRVFLIAEPLYAGMLSIKMCLRGAGDTLRVMWVSFGSMGFIRVGGLLLWQCCAPASMTLVGIWLLFTVDMAVQFVILRRMLYGLRWTRRQV
ncbi:MAG: MATE family efflux transporter [Akkermansia sp.]